MSSCRATNANAAGEGSGYAEDIEPTTAADRWWAWHDQDASRASATMAEAEQRCAAWVAGESDDGPDREDVEPATADVEVRSADREPTVDCECGAWSGERCQWSGPESETVVVEYMPEQHRASHSAAGNRGMYPHNGASRIRVERSCAARMVEHDGEWSRVIADAEAQGE